MTEAIEKGNLHPALVKLLDLGHQLWDDGMDQSSRVILEACKELESALASSQPPLTEDSPTLEQQMEDIRASMEGCSDSEWANLLETLIRNASRALAQPPSEQCAMCDSKNIDRQRTKTVCKDCGAETTDLSQSQEALIAHLKARLEQPSSERKDGERYRWARKQFTWEPWMGNLGAKWILWLKGVPDISAEALTEDSVAQTLDAAIDAAMKGDK